MDYDRDRDYEEERSDIGGFWGRIQRTWLSLIFSFPYLTKGFLAWYTLWKIMHSQRIERMAKWEIDVRSGKATGLRERPGRERQWTWFYSCWVWGFITTLFSFPFRLHSDHVTTQLKILQWLSITSVFSINLQWLINLFKIWIYHCPLWLEHAFLTLQLISGNQLRHHCFQFDWVLVSSDF